MNLDDLFEEDWPEDHRSGIVAVVGRPNVGKSTLINGILGQKIAITTHKPQTTRKQQLGIYTVEHAQILFVDTPGLHKPHNKLGEYMVTVATNALRDADVILWVMDGSEPPSDADHIIVGTLRRAIQDESQLVLALNKSDLEVESNLDKHRQMIEHEQAVEVSALTGKSIDHLIDTLIRLLPFGPRYYPADQVSEVNLRFIAAEVIREKIIENTEQEIPYSVAVGIEEFKERSTDMTYISAVVYVERDSQKGIVVGKNGKMIKQVGIEARTALAELIGTKIYLDLHVKVLKNWRSDIPLLRRLGYRLPRPDDR